MKKKIMIIACSFLLAMPVLGFAKVDKAPNPNVSAYERANENAKFKRGQAVYNNEANKEIRAKEQAEEEAVEAEKEKKEAEEAQDKGEGQVHLKF